MFRLCCGASRMCGGWWARGAGAVTLSLYNTITTQHYMRKQAHNNSQGVKGTVIKVDFDLLYR